MVVATTKSNTQSTPPRGRRRPEFAAIINAGQVNRSSTILTTIIAVGTLAVIVMYIFVFVLADDDGVDQSAFTAPTTTEPAATAVAASAADPTPTETSSTVAPAAVALAGPSLAISTPANDARVTVRNIVLSGQSDPNATVIATVAGVAQPTQVGSDGAWTLDVELESGSNFFLITATDAAGNSTQNGIRVFYDPPTSVTSNPGAATTPASAATPAPSYWHLDAAQGPTPSTHIVGTTSPGAWVSVTSAYGNANTVSDADGAWTVDLAFTDAPINEEFLVTVAVAPVDGPAAAQQFPFTYLGAK